MNDCIKLLDNGWRIRLFRNQLDSYTAIADKGDMKEITDDFTVEKVLARITEKVFKTGEYAIH